jgi:hypothetical protein
VRDPGDFSVRDPGDFSVRDPGDFSVRDPGEALSGSVEVSAPLFVG